MEDIEIVLDDGTKKVVKMKSVCGRHALQLWNVMGKLTSDEGEQDIAGVMKYRALLTKLTSELTGMKEDELEDLPIDEKRKFFQVIEDKTRSEMGFTTPSQT